MNYDKFIIEEFFSNNEKVLTLNLEPLEPQEIIYLATDWMSEFSNTQIISIFKIENHLGNYQYFVLDNDLDIMEYIPDKHYFFLDIDTDIKNKLINLFTNNDEEKIKKRIYNNLIAKLEEEKNL